ncbi:MAG TPA: NifX-associated nitrogen fixation protein [Rhodocyclaceae bacterium]|nr:NifX-associated nitrogen fixation protein [Rhodocyclaceae bacterium]
MSTPAPTSATSALSAEALPDSEFLPILVRQLRAHDVHGFWSGKPDAALLADYIVTREQKRAMPLIADPDAKLLWRVEQFYCAVALAVERETEVMATVLMKVTSEGFGRVVVIAGRLIIVDRNLRDVHRFGFESFEKLGEEGLKLTRGATKLIGEYPEVARL